jgi:hypothetical protein
MIFSFHTHHIGPTANFFFTLLNQGMDLSQLRLTSVQKLREDLNKPTKDKAPIPIATAAVGDSRKPPHWGEALYYPIAVAESSSDAKKECARCFDDPSDSHCESVALSLFINLTQSSILVSKRGVRTNVATPVVVIYDLEGPWKNEWVEKAGEGALLIVVHARTLRVARAYFDTTEFGEEYALPISIPYMLGCWDNVTNMDKRSILQTIASDAVEIEEAIAETATSDLVYQIGPKSPPEIWVRDYQPLAIKIARDNRESTGTVLCMGTGTGKTRTSLKLVETIHRDGGGAEMSLVVVAPDAAYLTFRKEIRDHHRGWAMHRVDSAELQTRDYRAFEDTLNVLFVPHSSIIGSHNSRDGLKRMIENLPHNGSSRLYLIVDEAHHTSDEVKRRSNKKTNDDSNPAVGKRPSHMYETLLSFAPLFDHRIVMSGTPFVNKSLDIRRMLSLASGNKRIDMTEMRCDEELRTRYIQHLRVSIVWLMNEFDFMPQVKYMRHTVEMRPYVWNTLSTLYARQAKASVEKEFNFFKQTDPRGAVGENFVLRLMKSLRHSSKTPDDIKQRMNMTQKEIREQSPAALARELEANAVWDYDFYTDPLWTKDVFRTQSEQFTFRKAFEFDPSVESIQFYAQDADFTTDDGQVDDQDNQEAACFQWVLEFVDKCFDSKQFPIVLHASRLDPGVKTLHNLIVKHIKTKYADISPYTVGLITGDVAKLGNDHLLHDDEETQIDDTNSIGYVCVCGKKHHEFRVEKKAYMTKPELAEGIQEAIKKIKVIDTVRVTYASRQFSVHLTPRDAAHKLDIRIFNILGNHTGNLPEGVKRTGLKSTLGDILGGVCLQQVTDNFSSLDRDTSDAHNFVSKYQVPLKTKLEQICEYFKRGEIDILLMSRIAREGTEFIPSNDLTEERYDLKWDDEDGERILTINRAHTIDGKQTFPKNMKYLIRKPRETVDPEKPQIPVWLKDKGVYHLNRLPPVRHFCHIGMLWNSASMRQAEARVIRRKSHPMNFDSNGYPQWPMYGEIQVHTVLTVGPPDRNKVFKTFDERMERFIYKKDAEIYETAHLLATNMPKDCTSEA